MMREARGRAGEEIGVVMPKSGSVRFFAIFAELRTGLMVRFKRLAEL